MATANRTDRGLANDLFIIKHIDCGAARRLILQQRLAEWPCRPVSFHATVSSMTPKSTAGSLFLTLSAKDLWQYLFVNTPLIEPFSD
jgi:hypothetical protein